MASTIGIRIVLFAMHREVFGRSNLEIEMPGGADLDAVFAELVRREPRMAELRPFTTFALNREVVDARTSVRDGDEIALLQPVSGG